MADGIGERGRGLEQVHGGRELYPPAAHVGRILGVVFADVGAPLEVTFSVVTELDGEVIDTRRLARFHQAVERSPQTAGFETGLQSGQQHAGLRTVF